MRRNALEHEEWMSIYNRIRATTRTMKEAYHLTEAEWYRLEAEEMYANYN